MPVWGKHLSHEPSMMTREPSVAMESEWLSLLHKHVAYRERVFAVRKPQSDTMTSRMNR
jgi:hypothetical protein